MDEGVHFLDIFFLEPAKRIEVFDLGGDLGGKLSGIETGDSGDATAPFAQAFPRVVSSRSQRRYQTDASDHDSSLLQNTTSFTRSFLPLRACAARTAPTSLLRLRHMGFDVTDRVLYRCNFLGVFVWNFHPKALFQRHHQLDGVQRIRPGTINKGSFGRPFGFLHAQLFNNDLFHFVFNRGCHSQTLLMCRPPLQRALAQKQNWNYRSAFKTFSTDFSSSAFSIVTDLSIDRIKPSSTLPGPTSTNVRTP